MLRLRAQLCVRHLYVLGILAAAVAIYVVWSCKRHTIPTPSPDYAPAARKDRVPADTREDWERAFFRFVHETDNFRLAAAYRRVPLEQLGRLAEDALRVSRALLGGPTPSDTPVLPVYICGDVATIFTLERRHQLPYAADIRRANFVGGYYDEVPMIAIIDIPTRRSEVIAHEVAHWEMARVARRCPRVIDEGFAECVEEAVLATRQECAAVLRELRRRHARALALPSLEPRQLFALGYHDFRDERHFAASWCLVKVIIELERRGHGKLRTVIKTCDGEGVDAWTVLVKTYGEPGISELWQKERDAAAAWR